jgi:serine/threonine protein kinase
MTLPVLPEPDRCLCVVSGLVDGGPLDSLALEHMARGSLSLVLTETDRSPQALALWTPRTMMRVLLDVARGLDFLHHHNIIHRDVKSPNILLDDDFRAKVRTDGGRSPSGPVAVGGCGLTVL